MISTEVELKLAVRAEDLPELRRALAALAPGAATVRRHLVATYFDTPDLALKRAGSSLRVRNEEGRLVQTLKTADIGGANLLARGEWEDTVGDNRPDPQAPNSGSRLPDGAAGDLHPLFVTDIIREIIEIEPAPGMRVEAAIDVGEIRTLDGGRSEPIGELELELESGDPAALYDLALGLLEAAPLRLEARSKAERGYRLVAGDEASEAVHAAPVPLDPGMSAEEALQRIGRAGLVHLLRNEPAALAGRPEGVHQIRIAVRRLRSLLSAVKGLLSDDERRRAAGELAGLAGHLGPARNLDVFAGELLAPMRDDGAAEPGWDDLLAIAERERAAAYDRVRQEILSPQHTRAVLRLLRWFEGRGWRAAHPDGPQPDGSQSDKSAAALAAPIGAIAPQLLDRRRRGVRKRSRGFARMTPRERHRLRIAVKKLRYTAELLDNLYRERDARRYVKRLKPVQDGLGHANDVRVAYGLVIELGGKTDTRFVAGRSRRPAAPAARARAPQRRGEAAPAAKEAEPGAALLAGVSRRGRSKRFSRPSASVGGDLGRDRAGDAGAGEPAIAARVLGEVLLVIVLGKIKRRRVGDLGRDRAVAGAVEPRLKGLARRFGGVALRRREGVDRRTVLGSDIVPLAHALGRVVTLPEQFEQRLVAGQRRVVDDEHRLGVAGAAAAHLLIARVRGRAAGIADGGHPHPGSLPEHALGAPEAAEPENRLLEPCRIGPGERVAVDKVPVGRLDRLGAAGQAVFGPRNGQLVSHQRPHFARPLF